MSRWLSFVPPPPSQGHALHSLLQARLDRVGGWLERPLPDFYKERLTRLEREKLHSALLAPRLLSFFQSAVSGHPPPPPLPAL